MMPVFLKLKKKKASISLCKHVSTKVQSFNLRKPGAQGIKGTEGGTVKKIPVSVVLGISGDFPGDTVVKNLPDNAGDTGLSPGPGRSHMLRSN